MINATPAKLNDGSWGARCTAPVNVGDTVAVTTRAGKSWHATVTRIVWRGDGVSLLATASCDRASASAPSSTRTRRPPRGRRTGCSCGSIEDYPRDSDCASCQHDY